MPLNLPNPRYNRADKRKINEVSILNYDDDVIANAPKGPRSKRIKTDHPKSANTANKQWDLSMEMPQGKTRLHFTRDFTDVRISGNATTDDPEIVWLGRVPDDAEAKRANEYIARQAALKLNTITHVYIIYGTQSRMFVDRDRKRVHAWHVDDMKFKYRVLAADPHMFLAFGTGQDHINLYGYVHVTVDQKGNPTDFATSRNADHVVDGDDRIFELFEYDFDQGDCSPYCPTHAKGERVVHHCELAQPRYCPHHNTEGLLDHYCRRPRWRAEPFDDHYCPCSHDKTDLLDHYCPCVHERRRLTTYHCTHHIPRNAQGTHYCPLYSL